MIRARKLAAVCGYCVMGALTPLATPPVLAGSVDPSTLFEAPVALTDETGQVLITGKAQGCPFAADYDNDGDMDIILGAKENMDTATGGIWLIPNRRSSQSPAFSWADAVRVQTASGPVLVGCG